MNLLHNVVDIALVSLVLLMASVAVMVASSQDTRKDEFHRTVGAFLKDAESFLGSLEGAKSIKEVEDAGRKAMLSWGKIPTPTSLPSTQDIKGVRLSVNALARMIGMQVMSIADDGALNVRFAHRLVGSAYTAARKAAER